MNKIILLVFCLCLTGLANDSLNKLLKYDVNQINSLKSIDYKKLDLFLKKWSNPKLNKGLPTVAKAICLQISTKERVTETSVNYTQKVIFMSLKHCSLNEQVDLINDNILGLDGILVSERSKKVEFIVEIWNNYFDVLQNIPKELPQLSVIPPKGTNLSPGASPDQIKDPKLKLEYEQAIAKNSEIARNYKTYHLLEKKKATFVNQMANFISTAYSQGEDKIGELEQILSKHH